MSSAGPASKETLWTTLVTNHLNFFRLHLLLFTIVPLLASLIFYWLNDARKDNEAFVSFIDSLFLCVSAATVAGLYPVVLSNLEVGQQIILALLTAVGSYSFVSTAMVVIRRFYFSKAMRKKVEEHIAQMQESTTKHEVAQSDEKRVLPPRVESPSPIDDTLGEDSTSSNAPAAALTGSPETMIRPSLEMSNSSTGMHRVVSPRAGHGMHNTVRRRTVAGTYDARRQRGVSMTKTDTIVTYKDRGMFCLLAINLRLIDF